MKILLIGSSGTIGKAVAEYLKNNHYHFNHTNLQLIEAHRTSKAYPLDICNTKNLIEFLNNHAPLDAIVSVIGKTQWEIPKDIKDYRISFEDKAFSQINLALTALDYLNPRSSITLTSGVVGKHISPKGSQMAIVNASIDAFVKTACYEIPNIRLNAVAPSLTNDTFEKHATFFPGQKTALLQDVAKVYARSIYGIETGKIFEVE